MDMGASERKFIVIIGSAFCSERDFGVSYSSDLIEFADRQAAIDHGFTQDRSDDFNIGVISGCKLIDFAWMGESLNEDEQTLRKIPSEIGLGA